MGVVGRLRFARKPICVIGKSKAIDIFVFHLLPALETVDLVLVCWSAVFFGLVSSFSDLSILFMNTKVSLAPLEPKSVRQ